METIENKVNNNLWKYIKFGGGSALFFLAAYVENNGKMLLIEHGLIDGNAWQITKDFFSLNWNMLPEGIKEGLIQIGAGYAVILPMDVYLGMNAFRWAKKRSIECFGEEHYMNRPISRVVKDKIISYLYQFYYRLNVDKNAK